MTLKSFIIFALAVIFLALTAAAQTAAPATAAAPMEEPGRTLSFYNIHTGGHLTIVYRRGDAYVPQALAEINHILRDPLCGDERAIDPGVLDFLYDLLMKLSYRGEVQVVCGYRTVETNATLHKQSSGVVIGSQHVQGRALDFRLPGIDSKKVWETARSMKRGGTGYYKGSDFVHIDTGRVRSW